MKMKKSFCALILAIVMLVSSELSMHVQASTVFLDNQNISKITFENGQFIGITSENSQGVTRANDSVPLFKNTVITIDYLDIHDGVNITGSISTDDGEVDFQFTGDMFISRKQDQGIEAYVGQVSDLKQNFAVKYFEIKNDTSYDLLKYSETYLNKRTISFDLERYGIKYYFEFDLDMLGVSFDAQRVTQLAPEEIDFYELYVDKELSTAPCAIPYDPEIFPITQSRSTYSYLAIGESWYHEQVVSGWFSSTTTYEYYALGGTEGMIVDVGAYGTANWTSALKFWGHVRKNGEKVTNIDNYFNIKAGVIPNETGVGATAGAPLEFTMYTGTNTIFTSGRFNGDCKISGTDQEPNDAAFDLVIGIVHGIASYLDPMAAGVLKLSQYASKLFRVTTTLDYSLGTDFITGVSGANPYIISNQFDREISLDLNEHSLFFTGFVSTINSNSTANHATNCVVRWRYNICNGNRVLASEDIVETVEYISNAK